MEISSMRKNSFIRFAVAATAVAVLAGTAFPANAAIKPAAKATIGDDCTTASIGKTAPGRGVDGSDLTCMVVTTGSYKGDSKWWYKGVTPLKAIDWTIPANPGGYSLTADAITNSLKAEGLLAATTSVFKPGAGGAVGLAAFQEIKGKPDAAIVTGIAMTGGLYSNKSTLNLLASTPIAKILREYEGIVVPASSKYRTLKQLMDDLVAKPNAVAIAGGNKGGVDHQTIGLLAQKAGVDPTKLNYVVYSVDLKLLLHSLAMQHKLVSLAHLTSHHMLHQERCVILEFLQPRQSLASKLRHSFHRVTTLYTETGAESWPQLIFQRLITSTSLR
jgi:putative tricarboxylic transport membrane protein